MNELERICADGVIDIGDEHGIEIPEAVAVEIALAVLATAETGTAPVATSTERLSAQEIGRLIDIIISETEGIAALPTWGVVAGRAIKDPLLADPRADRRASARDALLAALS